MEAFRILLILLILVIFIYVMSRLLIKRQQILAMKVVEGITTASQDEVATLKAKYPANTTIKSIASNRSGMTLAQYCIKGSYNSAYSGSLISDDAIKFVLSRGCRVLDLEIVDDMDNGLVVVYSKGGETIGRNKASLSTIFTAISTNAFFDMISPNSKDPLFIHLRVQESTNVYDKLATVIHTNFTNTTRLYAKGSVAKNVDGSTYLNDIMGKIIFLMDKTNNINWASDSQNLAKYINAEVGGTSWKMQTYSQIQNQKTSPPTITDNTKETDLVNISMLRPDNLELYPTPLNTTTIPDYGIQILLVKYYKYDDGVYMNEDLFEIFKAGVVPIAYAIQYLKDKANDLKSKTIDYSIL